MGTEKDMFIDFFKRMGVPFEEANLATGRPLGINEEEIGAKSGLEVSDVTFFFGVDDEYVGVIGTDYGNFIPREVAI